MPDTAINSQAAGRIVGLNDTGFEAARGATAGTVSTATQLSTAVSFSKLSGRGSSIYSFTRYFIDFDTSAITTTVTSATITIKSNSTGNSADIILVKSDAFGGGGSTLGSSDFDNLDFSKPYSDEVSSWNTNGSTNTITLNALARSDIQSNNNFVVAIVEHDHDFNGTDTEFSELSTFIGIESGGSDIHLDITHAASGFVHTVVGVAGPDLGEVKGVATANVSEVIGVS